MYLHVTIRTVSVLLSPIPFVIIHWYFPPSDIMTFFMCNVPEVIFILKSSIIGKRPFGVSFNHLKKKDKLII